MRPVLSLLLVSTITSEGTTPYLLKRSEMPVNCPPSLSGLRKSHSTILSSIGFSRVSIIP